VLTAEKRRIVPDSIVVIFDVSELPTSSCSPGRDSQMAAQRDRKFPIKFLDGSFKPEKNIALTSGIFWSGGQ